MVHLHASHCRVLHQTIGKPSPVSCIKAHRLRVCSNFPPRSPSRGPSKVRQSIPTRYLDLLQFPLIPLSLMLIRECQQPRGETLHLRSSVQTQELFAMLARVASLAVLELMTDIIISASCHRYVCVAWYVGSLVRWFYEPFSRALGDVLYVCQASLHTSLVTIRIHLRDRLHA
jgi:hypothetical protein